MNGDQIRNELRRIAEIAIQNPHKEAQAVGAILFSTIGCMQAGQAHALFTHMKPFLKDLLTDIEILGG